VWREQLHTPRPEALLYYILASPIVGAPIHVLEKLLNHSSGTLRGVASIYNRYSYWHEMREAVERYEVWLRDCLQNEAVRPIKSTILDPIHHEE